MAALRRRLCESFQQVERCGWHGHAKRGYDQIVTLRSIGHNRKLVFGGVSLTRTRLDHPIRQAVAAARNELEQLMIDSGYLDGAPFRWVSLIFRFGLEDHSKPHFQRIHPTHGDLPLAIEVDIRRINGVDPEVQSARLKIAALKTLIHAGTRYELKIDALKDELDRLETAEGK